MTDNGTGFTSEQFKFFLKDNSIKHITSAPYHPASNGLAERAVQIIKKGLKKVITGSMNTRLAQVLFHYCVTSQSTTGISPAELLLHQRLRTRLNLLRPNTPLRVEEKQQVQKCNHNARSRHCSFQIGDLVYAKNFSPGPQWIPGKVMKFSGPVSYEIQLNDERQRRCHIDHLRVRSEEAVAGDVNSEDIVPFIPARSPPTSTETATPENSTNQPSSETPTSELIVPYTSTTTVPTSMSSNGTSYRYPRQNRKPREHL